MDLYKLDKGQLIAVAEQLQTKLDKKEQDVELLHELYGDLFFRARLDGEIQFINPAGEKILGFTQEELIGKDITNYYLYSMSTKSLLRQLVKEKGLKDFEISLIHKYGKIIPSRCSLKLTYSRGWIIEGVVKDISELVHTREELNRAINMAQRFLKVKEEFLANMSHEIRTPLNGIMGMANFLSSSDLSPDQQKQVTAIQESSDILLRLLNNILDWSKLEAGKVGIKLSAVSPQIVFQKLFTMYEQKAKEKNINLSCKVNRKVPDIILTDEVKVLQVFSNLTSNAIKFTPAEGKIDVRLYVEKKRNDHVLLRGEVRDSGIGISDEDQKKLFSSFTQIDSSSNKKHEGVGLGLSISRELINILGGEIGVSSEIDKGSIFWFTFISEVTEKKEQKEQLTYNLENLASKVRILLVDDNHINLEVASQILKNLGASVTAVGSGNEALKLLVKNKFDLIFLDIQMPEMSGVEVMQWMRNNLNEVPPTLALTAYSGETEKSKFLDYGFDDFIAKPIEPEFLASKVKEWTEKQEQIIDRKVIEKLVEYGGKKMVKEALNEFCDETEEQIRECFVSLSNNNHKKILDLLHALKGNAGTLGINKIASKARQIEEQLRKGYVSRLEHELKGLDYFFKEFKIHYNET